MDRRAPRSLRPHIGLFGRRNAGKSSLVNALARQPLAIVSPEPGTTTDPVEKAMELLPAGPVVLVDTAGLDDDGTLGRLRAEGTRRILGRVDLALLVAEGARWGAFEEDLLAHLAARRLPRVVVLTKSDRAPADPALVAGLVRRGETVVETAAPTGAGIEALHAALLRALPASDAPPLIRDLVGPGQLALFVVPIDAEAPAGRLILPQVRALRDLLDGEARCLVVGPAGVAAALADLRAPPRLVVTDSQAFAEVAAQVPAEVPLTGFSVLFARHHGDLTLQAAGAAAIDALRPGDRVLVAEACTHHPVGEDIGRVKIPRWLAERVGGPLDLVHVQGRDFPDDLSGYRLVVHCGACMITRRAMQARLEAAREASVPITNYGLAIAARLGILGRALGPFPDALAAWRAAAGGA